MSRPKVSILTPAHRPALLHDAMGTVMNQTYQDFQHLIGYARPWWPTKINELAKAAIGDYLCVLCDDDLLAPTYLAETMAHAGHGVIYTDWGRLNGETISYWPSEPWALESFQSGGSNPLCGATYLIHHDVWDTIGGIDPEQTFWDWATAYACFKSGASAKRIEQPLAVYRVHDNHDRQDDKDAMQKLHRKYPELKRAA